MREFPDPTGGWLILTSSAVLAIIFLYAFMRLDIVQVFVAATALGLPLTLYHSTLAAGSAMPKLHDVDERQQAVSRSTTDISQKTPNVVFIVFDEFPLTTLLGADGTIDGRRFPNLRALADEGTWFRQTSSVSCSTPTAVPAILSGKLFGQPTPESLSPLLRNYPRNLFTLLGRTHEIKAWETLTRLCPPGICGGQNERTARFPFETFASHLSSAWLHATLPGAMNSALPELDAFWMEAAAIQDVPKEGSHQKLYPVRVQQFRQLVDSIGASDRPWLRFGHFLMPHTPFENLPDGTF
jgi:hypothetical protein